MSSSINENVILNIKQGQGLSQAIDEQLDKELNTNVKLGLSEWQSIFDLIRHNQVAENKTQFGEKDSDIRNRKHYVLSAGLYQITKNVWNEILNIAKKSLGIATNEKEPDKVVQSLGSAVTDSELKMDVKTPTLTTPNLKQEIAEQEQTTQQIVNQLLENAGINTEGLDINDIANKYDLIKRVNHDIDETALNERIVNYAKGLRYHNFEKNAPNNLSQNYENDCSKAKTYEELRTSYQQFGKEYAELFDMDGNLKANIHEIFYKMLIDKYTNEGMNTNEATKKAIDVLEQFQHYNQNNLPKPDSDIYNTDLMELFTNTMAQLEILDENKDGLISADEFGAYLMSVAQLNDTSNNISATETIRAEIALETQNMTIEEIMTKFDFDETKAKNIISFRNQFNSNLSAYQDFIIKGQMPE